MCKFFLELSSLWSLTISDISVAAGFDTIYTAVCNCSDRSTACSWVVWNQKKREHPDRGGLRLLGAHGWNLDRGPISNEEEGGKRIFWDYLRILFIPMWDIRPHIFGLGPLNGGGSWL